MNTVQNKSKRPSVKWRTDLKRTITGRLRSLIIIVFLIFSLSRQSILAQGVGISEVNITPDVSAILELRSTQRGLLVPRMTTAQRLAIASPGQGLLVYDTVTRTFWVYDSGWKAIAAEALGTSNQLLGMNATGSANEYKTLSGTANQINVLFAPGSINLSAPQDIHTGASPVFVGLTLSGLTPNSGVYTNGTNVLTSTPPSTGILGYWTRTGTILNPSNAGDAITTTGNIYTTGTGAITSAGLLTGSSGASISGGAINLNNGSNFITNINTGTSTGNISIGGLSNSVFLPKFTTAGVVHNDATGLLSSGLIVNSDITNGTIDLVSKVTGILPIANGGTNSGTALSGQSIMVSDGSSIIQGDKGTATTVLHGDASGLPAYSQIINADIANGTIDLVSKVTGVLPVTNGGTGYNNSYTNGQLLIGNAAGTLTRNTLTGTVNQVLVTNGDGTITLATQQDINTTSSPTFAGLTISGLLPNAGVYTDNANKLTSTPPTSGILGYWSRTGTTLSPTTAGDAVTTTGNISTTGTGTITSAGLLTGTTGAVISGGAINLNNGSNFITNINTGTSTGNISIGGLSNSVFLPKFTTAGVVHNDATGLLSTGLIVNSDITNGTIDLVSKVTGILPIANGGTNSGTALTNNKIMVSSSGQVVEGPAGTATTLLHGNASGLPTYGPVTLTTDVTGVLPVLNGGTGYNNTYTNGQLLIGNAAGTLTRNTLTGTVNQVLVTNGDGTITLATPQDINTTSSPTFAGLTISGLLPNAGVYTDNANKLTSTPPTSGILGYWSRTGTTLSPTTAGDAVTTTGNISTTGTGTITSAGLLTGTTGAVISGGAINLNNGSNFITNINTGTSTGNVSIGGLSNSVFLPKFTTAGVVHNDATGLLSTGLIVNSDITNGTIDLVSKVTGILPIANGGTNSGTALTNNKIMVSSSGQVVEGPAGTVTTLLHGNASGLPTYGPVTLTTDVTGVLPVLNGGTGYNNTYTNGQLLIGNAAGTLTRNTLTGTVNQVLVTNGDGTITLATPQDINTTSSPTFAGMTITGLLPNAGVYTDNANKLTSTPPTSGILGYWSRTGTTLSPTTAGDAVTTTGNISTTGTGTITSAGLLTGTTGASISGGAINLNNGSNFITNINTGTSTGNISIGGLSNSVFLPKFTTAGVVHNDATGLLSSGLIINGDITNGTIDLVSKVTGVLPIANGGTNSGTALVNNRIMISKGGQIVELGTTLGDGQILIGKAGNDPQTVTMNGDVTINNTGTTIVGFVGGSSAANVNTATILANAATDLNTASTIVRRDATGNFSAGIITAALNGNAATATLASTVTTNANLTGPITSVGNVTSIASQTGIGTRFVVDDSPTLITPNIGVASAASLTATGAISGNQLTSTVATGTAPLVVTSTTPVANLSIGGNAATATTSITSTNFTGPLSGDVTGTQSSTVVSLVGGSTAANVHLGELLANAATNLNTANAIVKRDASGNFNAGIITAALNGNAATATLASTVTTNANLTGPITSVGNVTSIASQTGIGTKFVVDDSPTLITPNIGVASATSLTATGLISGNQLTSTVATGTAPLVVTSTTPVANLSIGGNAATATTAITSTNFTGPLSGDVTGTQSSTVVANVGGSSAANVNAATILANAATNLNTASTIVRRDATGNFAAGIITATLSGNATTSTTSANLSGGSGGSIPYQSAVNTTTMLANGTAGQILTSNGTTLAPSWITPTNGTVTSVGLSLPSFITVTNSPVTGSGTLTGTLASQAANTVFAAPDGSAGTPAFRTLTATDIPGLDWAKIISGKPTTLAGYGITDAALATHNHTLDGLSNVTIAGKANNDILQWNGTAWVNKTLSGAGILTTETDPIVKAINGIVKSNGTTISAAVAGTDYLVPNGSIIAGTSTKITYDAKGLVTAGTSALLASADFVNQGTTTTVLHGNGSGNPSWSQIVNADIDPAAGIVDTKLATISTANKVSNSATTATSSNSNNTIVLRDATGNFSAGTITASLSGNVTGNVTGNVSGTAANVTGTVAIANGGTGANDAAGARSNLGAAASGANTDITSVLLNQTGLVVKGGSANALTIKPNETLTAGRTLNIVTGDATRTLTFTGDASISGSNTGDETLASIKSKLGAASATTDGYLTTGDWNIFNTKQSALGFTPENSANRVIAFQPTPDNTHYPSEKLVYDQLALKAGSAQTFFLGTTSIAINRASGAQSLTGITTIDGSASKWTTARNLAGNSVDGSIDVSFSNKFMVQGTADAGLTGAQFLGSLTTGILKNTTITGVLTIATAGTDYVSPNASIIAGTGTKITYDAKGLVTAGASALLASADFAGQGSLNNVLHGGGAGNPSWSQIVNADIDPAAGIVDTKLATISTANKVSNSATTATSSNSNNTIVLRDATGNFSAGTITASLSGNVTGNASTATALATARAINGTNFDGTAAITVPVNSTDDLVTASSVYPLWTTAAGNNAAKLSTTKLSFVPSTGILSATGFAGSGAGLTNVPNGALANSSLTIGTTNIALGGTSTTLAGLTTVTSTTFIGALSGNATTASTLATARTINGTNFDGSTGITVPVNSTDDLATASSVYPLWTTAAGNNAAKLSTTKLSFVPSTGILTATGFAGSGAGLTGIPNGALTNASLTIGTTNIALGETSATLAGLTSVTSALFTGPLTGNVTGNASTANALATARAINGTNFDGTAAITVPVNSTDDLATVASVYPLWTTAAGNNAAKLSTTKLSFVPSTGILTATGFAGSGAGLTGIPNGALTNASLTIGTTNIALGGTSATLAGLTSVTSALFTGPLTGNVTGNASTATALATARAINGTNFDGTAAITVPVNSTDDLATVATVYPLWTTAAGNNAAKLSTTKLSFVPSTGILTATGFAGSGVGLTNVPNGALANSSLTIGTTNIALGGTSTTLAGLTSVTSALFSGPLTGNVTGNASTATALATARSIYGNNFDGTANLSQIIASTYGGTGNGFTKFTGPAGTEKTFTLPNGNATILTDNAAVTIAQGGTGQTAKAAAFNALSPITTLGDLIYGSAANTSSRLAGNITTTAMFLKQTGDGVNSTAPVWTAISKTDVGLGNVPNVDATNANNISSGTLAIANGGTGSATQNFVDLTTGQTVGGAKTWSNIGTFSAGLSSTGAAVSLNASSNFATNINTGTSTASVNIANGGTGGNAISIGNTNGATSIVERVGTGNYSLDGIGATTYTLGSSTVAGTITIGGTAQTGTITLGSSTAAQTLNLGTGTGSATVNIATGITNSKTVNIGTGAVANAITLGNGTGATSIVLNAGTGNIDIGANAFARTINIGTGAATIQTINIGGTGANVIGLGNTQTGGSITLGNALTTGSINIGGASMTTGNTIIRGGTGAGAISLTPGTAGSIVIGATAGTGSITVGSSNTNQTLNLGIGTGANSVNIATGGTGNVTIGNTTGTITIPDFTSAGIVHNNASGVLSTSALDLTADVTGTLPVGNGGTGSTTFTDHGVLLGSGAGAITATPTGSAGQLLQSGGSSDPSWTTATYPSTSGAPGNTLVSDGTNFVSTPLNQSQTSPADPAGTSSGGAMMGLAVPFTPNKSGKVLIIISGDITNNTGNDGGQVQIRYGTGGAPSNGAAYTGNTAGGLVKMTSVGATANRRYPFTTNAIVTLTTGTTYWIDLGLAVYTGGTASIYDLSVSIVEL